jgi:high-affinity iron transporter
MRLSFFGLSVAVFFSLLLPIDSNAITESETLRVRSFINLLDYIAKDYPMAVKDNEVVNEFEYAEMQEFSQNVADLYLELSRTTGIQIPTAIASDIDLLKKSIAEKASPQEVAFIAESIRSEILKLKLVPLSPSKWPNLENGSNIFAEACASCHGTKGMGDGVLAQGLTPQPSNFHDPEVINKISPLQAFNTISLGLEGTSMRAFSEYTTDEIWDLSFYVLSLQHDNSSATDEGKAMKVELEELASLSNEKLSALYPGLSISTVRTQNLDHSSGELALAVSLLEQSKLAVIQEDWKLAKDFSLRAYLQGVEPIEAKIKASDNSLFQSIESAMMAVRAAINEENSDDALIYIADAEALLAEAEIIIGNSNRSFLMTALIALSILLREGLEAFFVIMAILSILQSMQSQRAIRWVHGGWISAVLLGIAGWFFADALMQWDAQSRELMEGVIALAAVAVLLYLGFWMHGKTNAMKWKVFVETKVKGLISQNNMIGLASFSFVVVFREAFESVIFLSSLTADGSADSSLGVLIGSLSAAILLFLMAWSILRWFKRLPIHKVFLYSSIVVLALAFVLAGEGIHAMQEGGFIEIRSFPLNIKLSWIGLYPTYETILAQILVFALIIGLWKWSNKKLASA